MTGSIYKWEDHSLIHSNTMNSVQHLISNKGKSIMDLISQFHERSVEHQKNSLTGQSELYPTYDIR